MDDMDIKPLVAETGEASLKSLDAAMNSYKAACGDELDSYNQLTSDMNVLIQYYQTAANASLNGDNATAIAMANNEVMYSAKTVEDEIAQLSDGINGFLDILDNLINEIRSGSNTLNGTIQSMAQNIKGTDGNAKNSYSN